MSTEGLNPPVGEQDAAAPQPDDYTAALDVASHANDGPAPLPTPAKRKLPIPAIIAVVVVIALACVAFFAFKAAGPNVLQRAAEKCHTGTLSDKNSTLLFDMAGKEVGSGTGSYEDYQCLVTATDAPTSTQTEMGKTRALDGRQTDTWKTEDGTKIQASWSYHPDNGLDIIFELAE